MDKGDGGRGGAKSLSDHIQKPEENESIDIREIEGFSFDAQTSANVENAIKQMEATGFGKGDKRNLYHAILAPAYGEKLNAKQRDFMIDYYA